MSEQPSDSPDSSSRTVLIVRYPNRRLYDRTNGRYITLTEIAAQIRAGKEVAVRDSKTNQDLTSMILTVILLESHPERIGLFPSPLLHLMIRSNDIVLGFLREYLRQSSQYLELWQRMASFGSVATPLDWLKNLLPGHPGTPTPSAGPTEPLEREVLLRRLAELERRLDAITPSEPEDPPSPPEDRTS